MQKRSDYYMAKRRDNATRTPGTAAGAPAHWSTSTGRPISGGQQHEVAEEEEEEGVPAGEGREEGMKGTGSATSPSLTLIHTLFHRVLFLPPHTNDTHFQKKSTYAHRIGSR